MANNLVGQGSLNRLLASMTFADHPELNVTKGYLGKSQLMLNLEGVTTAQLPTQTGFVNSPEPYQIGRVTIHLLKTQGLANIYKAQIENNTVIGDSTCRSDSSIFNPYNLANCSISGTEGLAFDGTTPDYTVTVTGIYYINASLFV